MLDAFDRPHPIIPNPLPLQPVATTRARLSRLASALGKWRAAAAVDAATVRLRRAQERAGAEAAEALLRAHEEVGGWADLGVNQS